MNFAAVAGLCLALLPGAGAAAENNRKSLERDIARMLLVGTRGSEVTPDGDFERFVCGLGVGGILLFDRAPGGPEPKRNILSHSQLERLTENLQVLARRCGDAPLLIAADVEGGKVNRLSGLEGLGGIKSAAWLGRRSARRSYDEGGRIASALSRSGVNWNLAPVVDLALNLSNPVIAKLGRSYSADPETVSAHAKSFVLAHRDFGVLTCLKHFPGHGSSRGDSHAGAVDVTETAHLEAELRPYRELLAAGLVDCVMPGHLYNRNLDDKRMATLSSATLTGLLRGELGYDGLVLSDDLQMGAVKDTAPIGEAAVQAVLAGADMLTLSYSRADKKFGAAAVVHRALVESVRAGIIPQARIDEANRRIRALKSGLESESP